MEILKTALFSSFVCILGVQQFSLLDSTTHNGDRDSIIWVENDAYGSRVFSRQTYRNNKKPIKDQSYYTGQEGVIRGHQLKHIALNSRNHQLMAFDKRRREIIGIELFAGQEIGALTNNTLVWTVYSGTSSKVNGIDIDSWSGTVYWTDGKYETIFASKCHYDSKAYALVDVDLENPFGIAISAEDGFLFWSDLGKNSKIERSYLDGTHREVLINETSNQVFKPTALTLDTTEKKLYWIDVGSKMLMSCTYDGQNLRTIRSEWKWITYLVFFQNHLVGLKSKSSDTSLIFFDKRDGSIIRRDSHQTNKSVAGLVASKVRTNEIDTSVTCSMCSGLCVTGKQLTGVCTHGAKASGNNGMESDEPMNLIYEEAVGLYRRVLLLRDNGLYYLPRNFADLFGKSKRQKDNIQINPFYTSQNYDGRLKLLTVDPMRQYAYIYDDYIKVIIKLSLKDAEAHSVHRVAGNVSGMIADWKSGNIYYTDVIRKELVVLTKDGTYSKIVMKQGLVQPQALGIHRHRRFLVLANIYPNSTTGIISCSLDGTSRRIIAIVANEVTSLVVDSRTDVLFFSNFTGNIATIVSLQLTTGKHKILQTISGAKVMSMDVMNKYLIWIKMSTSGHNDIFAIDKISGHLIGFNRQNVENQKWSSLAFNHMGWTKLQGPCQTKNGGCEQLCLENSIGYRCACTHGYQLYKSLHCRQMKLDNEEKFFLVADQIGAVIYQVNFNLSIMSAIPLIGLKQPYAVTYNYGLKTVYWSDLEMLSINRASLDGSFQEILLVRKQLYATDIEVDPRTGTLYFVDYSYDRLGVLNTQKLTYNFIARQVPFKRPFGIAIDMTNDWLYLTSEGQIFRLNLDGSEYKIESTWPRKPRGIAKRYNEIFWVEMPGANIYQKNLTSNEEDLVLHFSTGNLYDIAADSKYIYITNGSAKSIIRFDDKKNYTVGKLNLLQPAGLHLASRLNFRNDNCSWSCNGPCLKQKITHLCMADYRNATVNLPERERCIIPKIRYGYIKNNKVGAVVPNHVILEIGCIAAHHLTSNMTVICTKGEWSHIPRCVADYEIFGSISSEGWVKFTEPGKWHFYIYEELPDYIHTVLIGGGGGGFNADDKLFDNLTKAGGGGHSAFGNFAQVFGGTGGSKNKGGVGGRGGTSDGGDGTIGKNCTTGGSAGKFRTCLYCGTGGYSSSCSENERSIVSKSRCNVPPSGENDGGLYGGGSGGNNGGSGGGGGYRCTSVSIKKKKNTAVEIIVGDAGQPSYGKAGTGLVLIMWGYGDSCVPEHVIITC